nr:protein kinase [Myxococcota bacterium]
MPDEREVVQKTVLGTPPPRSALSHSLATPRPTVASDVAELTLDGALTDPTKLPPGTRIQQYELIRELGRGGMGIVYAARDVKLGRRVAMKFLISSSREVADRFLVEARATAQCSHDHIVIIHEVDEYDGIPYLVLEFLEGQTLRELIGEFNDSTRLPPSRVVELVLPIARALERAHDLGIVHRDLKPENVFVTSGGAVKVLDFGIAKALAKPGDAPRPPSAGELERLADGDGRLTREGTMVGTLAYMCPEQAGLDEVDHRADLWAVGVMMFEMLTGRHPIEPLRNDVLIQNLVTADPMPALRGVLPDVPDGLADLVDGCLQKAKLQRLPSSTALASGLEELLPNRHGRTLRDGEGPYPGLAAFQEADAHRFFGRSREIARMVAKIRELPLTAVIGPSGAGKSSFIRAGVGPALKASGERWDVVTLRPGRQPLAALASVVQRLAMRTSPQPRDPSADEHELLLRRLSTEPGYLGVLLRERARVTGGTVLLFVDQFEELYTLVADPVIRRAFTATLTGVADDSAAPVRVVVSMRSDFLDRVSEDLQFSEELARGLVFLAQPDRESLREAIEQPVDLVGYRFESAAIVGEMIDALAGMSGALPLLQFAAAKLWDARDRQQRLLTTSSYHAIGGISGALAAHADDVYANLNASSKRLAQRIFQQLVTPERTRAILELSELDHLGADHDEVTRVVDQLVAARLLVVQTRAEAGGSVELVHESLIDRWPMLRRWLDEDAEDTVFMAQLTTAAKQWDSKGRPAGLLWRGDAMDEARRWARQRPRTLSARDQAFIDAVFA